MLHVLFHARLKPIIIVTNIVIIPIFFTNVSTITVIIFTVITAVICIIATIILVVNSSGELEQLQPQLTNGLRSSTFSCQLQDASSQNPLKDPKNGAPAK